MLPISAQDLQRKLPNISAAVRAALLAELHARPANENDRASIREVQQFTQSSAEIASAVCLMNAQGRTVDNIMIDGTKFFAVALAANDAGVEFRSEYAHEYRYATGDQIEDLKQAKIAYAADVAHCEKLLRDLPVALKNSEKALAEVRDQLVESCAAADAESAVVCMTVEQGRIVKEIKTQEAKLKSLKENEPAFDKSRFTLCAHRNQMTLKFGWNTIGETVYQLIKVDQIPENSNIVQVVSIKSQEPPAKRQKV